MIHVLRVLFAWPDGILVGNLLASALVGSATFTAGVVVGKRGLRGLHARIRKTHEQQAETHRLVAELHAHHLGSQEDS